MNAMENYKIIVENIFNTTIDIPNNGNINNCIGALNSEDNLVFKTNYIERLKRIYEYYKGDPNTIKNIVTTAKTIALEKGYKWSGPYSELITLDYWIQYDNIRNIKYIHKDNVNIFPDSIAKQIGLTEIDLDLSLDLSRTKIYLDVKSLIPTHLELVDQIFDKLNKLTGTNDYLIGIDDLFEIDYLQTKKDYVYELQSGTLVAELQNCIKQKVTYLEHILQSGNKAKFRITYKSQETNTVLTTMRSMCPYRLARDYKYKLLDYYNKLLMNEPSFITLVANPWFNKEINDFNGFNEVFYRALSRRVFMELTKNTDDMGIYYSELRGKNIKICDIAKLITGIIFIDDNSILKTGKDIYKIYVFTNPNSTNKNFSKFDFDILAWSRFAQQPSIIDDFKYDNY